MHIITGNDNGGGAIHVFNICKYSSKFENVIGAVGRGYLYDNAIKENLNIVLFKNLKSINEINTYVRENKIDIINFHGAKAFLMHRLFKWRLKAPCVATVHSDYRYDFLNNKIKSILFTPLSKLGIASFKSYICVSTYIKELLENEGFKGKKVVISNGIDTNNIQRSKDLVSIKKSIRVEEKDFAFIMVARLHPVKNHKSLINAFFRLTKDYEDTKLILVGEGELKEQLIEQVESLGIIEKVIFTGFKENSLEIVEACNVSILTSLNEGGSPPLVVLESAIMKVPIISTKVGDIEQVIDDSMGFIIERNTEENIYEAMKEAYLKRECLKSMGETFYHKVVKDYSMERFTSAYYSFYKEVIEKTI